MDPVLRSLPRHDVAWWRYTALGVPKLDVLVQPAPPLGTRVCVSHAHSFVPLEEELVDKLDVQTGGIQLSLLGSGGNAPYVLVLCAGDHTT